MVEEKLPETADRPQGLLNRRYRRYLLGESDIEPRTQAERDIRMNIRQRLYNGLLDFILVYQYIEQRDIDMALGELKGDDRLNRDEAIANAMALFFELGGEELTDTGEFEHFAERAALLSWRAHHDTDDTGGVWLGEPNVDLAVEFPNRIDTDDLMDKVNAVWDRLLEIEPPELDELDDQRGGIGIALGLDSLSADEVLYLTSIFLVASDDKSADLVMVKGVVQAWLVWRQQVRHNLPPDDRDMLQFLQEAIRHRQHQAAERQLE